jgi:hypothetical protein
MKKKTGADPFTKGLTKKIVLICRGGWAKALSRGMYGGHSFRVKRSHINTPMHYKTHPYGILIVLEERLS